MKTKVRVLSIIFLAAVMSFLAVPVTRAAVEDSTRHSGYNLLDQIECLAGKTNLGDLKQQALKNWGLLIAPYFKSGMDYTTNVFKSPEKRIEDVVWKFTPGVNLTYTNPMGQIGLNYEADFVYFTKNGDQNEQNQNFSVYTDLHPTEKLTLRISEELRQIGATAGAAPLEPVNFLDNTVKTSAAWAFTDMITSEIGYQNFTREYAGDLSDAWSYSENTMFLRQYYKFCDGPKVYVGYDLGHINYDIDMDQDNRVYYNTRDSYYHEFPVGAEGMLPLDIYYSAMVGIQRRDMQSVDRNDWWGFVTNILLRKKITKSTSVETGFLRRPVETTFDDQTFYDEKMFWAGVTQILTKKMRGRMTISYGNRDFEQSAAVGLETAKRDDDTFGFGLGIDYALRKWMVLNLDYRVERRDSNISDFDYTDNTLSIGTTIPL